MRVFSPFFSSRLLFATGTCALLVALVVLITGGFTIHAGAFRFSAHHLTAPLLVTAVAWLGAALRGRTHLIEAASCAAVFIERHAASGAIVLAATSAATGVAFGTYAASSSDASGYVSQAELLASGRLARTEPLARVVGWPDAEWAFSPLGYRPGREPGEIVPTYPPGLPVTMVPARILGGESGPFLITSFLAALAVFCTYALGCRLHSRTAGLIAAALLTTSPIFLFQVVQPMSDVPATAWVALALTCALASRRVAAFAAGAATGVAFLTRPNLVPIAAAVALVIAGWPRATHGTTSARGATTTRLVLFGAGLIPAIAALAFVQLRLYGSSAASGYGDVNELFAFSNIGANIRDYVSRLLTGEAPALALAACALAGLIATRRANPLPSTRSAILLLAVVGGFVLATYLPYGIFSDWSYLRFLLPAFPLAFVVVGALVANVAACLPTVVRGLTVLIAVTAVSAFNVIHAEHQQAFNLRWFEARYRDAGRYLAATLPSHAVVITSQESGSVSHYTRLPIVRWDLLNVDVDAAVDTLRARGRHPVVLLEDWEVPAFRKKFPGSSLTRLDWRPRAEFGDAVKAHLFDPSDRDLAPAMSATDRVH